MSLTLLIFYLFLIDALLANLFAFTKNGKSWYQKNFSFISRHLPLAKGWTLYYLFVVLIFGCMLFSPLGIFW
ncbi:MAG: hypothetical protein WDZ80_01355 [Candidatus Paceibacterota bacterium]